MVKKKGKRVNSEAALKKKQAFETLKKINPFEVHQNKEKFKILGRKNKHDHGLPGISRGKAVKKRKETLGKEFETRNKTNKFKDHRISENLSNEEIANLRFAALQKSKFNKAHKKDLFNLNDDEILTHKGHTLEEVEQFKDEASDESDADETLDADFTKAAHFGGGEISAGSDRKSAIEDMIIEAKRRKVEILKDKEEVLQMTSKLDESYKMLLPQLGKLNSNYTNPQKKQLDDYDKIMREMIFEPRGEVTDKLKTKEEIDKKEKLRLEKLEKERIARMKPEEIGDKPKHISADDLDDGYFMHSEEEDEGKILAYDINGETDLGKNYDEPFIENGTSKGQSGEKSEEDSSEGEESEEDDDLQDLKDSASSDEGSDGNVDSDKLDSAKVKLKTKLSVSENKKLQNIKEIPTTLEEFSDLLLEKEAECQGFVIKKLIQHNNPKLDGQNREKISLLYKYSLEYLDYIFNENCDIENSFKILDQIMPYLFDMVQLNPEGTAEQILKIIKTKYEKYKLNTKKVPAIDTIIIFKIISNLYSTSDFRHPVVTPSVIFISHILTRCNFKSRKDISLGLFLVTVVLEYTNFSKRFLPAAFYFLLGIIILSIPKKTVQVIKVISPFESIAATLGNNALCLGNKIDNLNFERKLSSLELITDNSIDDNFRIKVLNTTFELINEFAYLLIDNVGGRYIAEKFINLMDQLDLENYPEIVSQNYMNAKKTFSETYNYKLSKLVPPVRKPKALRLFEPRFEKVSDDKRRRKMSEEKTMRVKLIHKIKRETKGAEREIRRDTQFLNKIKIKKQIQSDLERKEKVRRIFAEASVQQGELNALERLRKKTKF
ncbi:nucleolar protein 14 homolog [Condylostylus longicornis]|uniref:nucleolar protein 14 homolog n=1 Tax=Condylostylus longicornis TaxID=2530218 RepID=UPI00244E45B4|nr:nucleolar protein 14 homolog [Condylostylus longicornis]